MFRKVLVVLNAVSLVLSLHASPQTTGEAKIKLPSGKVLRVTKAQIEALKTQPGIQYVKVLPTVVEKGIIAVQIPETLDGGYILGTPSAIASAFNAAGITVGLTSAGVTAAATTIAGVIIATIGGIIIAAITGGKAAPAHRH